MIGPESSNEIMPSSRPPAPRTPKPRKPPRKSRSSKALLATVGHSVQGDVLSLRENGSNSYHESAMNMPSLSELEESLSSLEVQTKPPVPPQRYAAPPVPDRSHKRKGSRSSGRARALESRKKLQNAQFKSNRDAKGLLQVESKPSTLSRPKSIRRHESSEDEDWCEDYEEEKSVPSFKPPVPIERKKVETNKIAERRRTSVKKIEAKRAAAEALGCGISSDLLQEIKQNKSLKQTDKQPTAPFIVLSASPATSEMRALETSSPGTLSNYVNTSLNPTNTIDIAKRMPDESSEANRNMTKREATTKFENVDSGIHTTEGLLLIDKERLTLSKQHDQQRTANQKGKEILETANGSPPKMVPDWKLDLIAAKRKKSKKAEEELLIDKTDSKLKKEAKYHVDGDKITSNTRADSSFPQPKHVFQANRVDPEISWRKKKSSKSSTTVKEKVSSSPKTTFSKAETGRCLDSNQRRGGLLQGNVPHWKKNLKRVKRESSNHSAASSTSDSSTNLKASQDERLPAWKKKLKKTRKTESSRGPDLKQKGQNKQQSEDYLSTSIPLWKKNLKPPSKKAPTTGNVSERKTETTTGNRKHSDSSLPVWRRKLKKVPKRNTKKQTGEIKAKSSAFQGGPIIVRHKANADNTSDSDWDCDDDTSYVPQPASFSQRAAVMKAVSRDTTRDERNISSFKRPLPKSSAKGLKAHGRKNSRNNDDVESQQGRLVTKTSMRKKDDLAQLLGDLGEYYLAYAHIIRQEGYSTMDELQGLELSELTEMGVKKGHAKRILRAIFEN